MRIGVDAHVLAGKYQGTRTYLYNLYSAICHTNNIAHEFVFFGRWKGRKPFGDEVEYVDYPSESRFKRLTFETSPLIKKYNIDVFHVNYNAPLLLPCKLILTLHDILWETHKNFFKPRLVLRNKLLSRLSVKRATQIHTVSEYTRRTVIEKYRVPEKKICVVPNGVDFSFYTEKRKSESIEKIVRKYGIKDFLLTVGRLEPRKNHIGLFKAYYSLYSKMSDIPKLVVIGQRDFLEKPIFDMVERFYLKEKIIFLENISDSDLPDFYRAAKLFIYPSFAEGFGLPPLEAMACGTPVITSQTTSLPEVVGDAALLIDPYKSEPLAEALGRIINNDELLTKMSKMGLDRSKIWTWEDAAHKYLAAIELMK